MRPPLAELPTKAALQARANFVEASCMHRDNREGFLVCRAANEELCGYCACASMLRFAAELVEREQALRELATALVTRIDAIHADPLYLWVWLSAQIHGIDYSNGPKYDVELKALRDSLGLTPETTKEGEMITVDGRCGCHKCEARTGNIYRMVGTCRNCGMTPVLMLFREGDETAVLRCPTCGNRSLYAGRLAGADEIPAPHPTRGEEPGTP